MQRSHHNNFTGIAVLIRDSELFSIEPPVIMCSGVFAEAHA